MKIRLVVVDDDDIQRRGMAEFLADQHKIEVVGTLDHGEAIDWDVQWEGVDVAVIDAADPSRSGDQFPGVAVVEHIRRRRAPGETTVIIVTGHFFDDAVRRRMREAGADYFFHRAEIRKRDALYEVVLHPEHLSVGVPTPRDPDALIRMGIGADSRVNGAVNFALTHPSWTAGSQRSRSWATYRRAFNSVARLQPMNSDGTPPDRDQDDPSLSQIERFVKWATRIKH